MERVAYDRLHAELRRVLLGVGFAAERAELCATLFAEASRDGVYTHGLNRFPRFIRNILDGDIDPHGQPTRVGQFGAMERWDGNGGPGNLNAYFSMNRAIELARTYGLGCVAIRNTNHWMRAGAYGWQAAEAGCVGICWTNTIPNMPPWGAGESKLGNNPIVLAVPRPEGHVVLDMAMSMFSYGKLESYAREGRTLPVDGGFDEAGELSRDPAAIMRAQRPLPIGYWKGSGLSLLLDLIATVLSGGNSALDVGRLNVEKNVSQTFIAFDLSKLPDGQAIPQAVEAIIDDVLGAAPLKGNGQVQYPGQGVLRTRQENMLRGVPVEPAYWAQVLAM